jgi:hypothetical protein
MKILGCSSAIDTWHAPELRIKLSQFVASGTDPQQSKSSARAHRSNWVRSDRNAVDTDPFADRLINILSLNIRASRRRLVSAKRSKAARPELVEAP